MCKCDISNNNNNQNQEESLFEEQVNLSVVIIATSNQIPENIFHKGITSEVQHDIGTSSACDDSLSPAASITDIASCK